VGDGVADDTAAILAAATAAAQSDGAKVVGFPRGTYNCRPNQLILGVSPTDFTGVKFMGPGRGAAVIKKIDNGDLIRIFTNDLEFHGLEIDGNGASGWTGRGIYIEASGENFVWSFGTIKDTLGPCIEWAGERGTYSLVENSRFYTYFPTASAVIRPTHGALKTNDDANNPQNRKIISCDTLPFHDLLDDGGQITRVIDCSTYLFRFGLSAKKGIYVGNRVSPSGGQHQEIHGIEHVFQSNIVGTVLEIGADVYNSVIGPNVVGTSVAYPTGIRNLSAPGSNLVLGGHYNTSYQVGPEGSVNTTWDPPSLAPGEAVVVPDIGLPSNTFTFGDFVEASFDKDLQGCVLTAAIQAAGTAKVVLFNPALDETGAARATVDLASGTLYLRVRKR
jgi:hypothetical protein